MSKNLSSEIDKDRLRERLNKYTRKAFQILPEFERPRILDIGCGSGVPTLELARLSNGEIIGIDINQSSLNRLNSKIEEEGFSGRVKTLRCSLFEMNFPNESFDIIWAEGSISLIGFGRGLREWNRLLKTNGFLVVHDDIIDVPDKLEKIPICGYRLVDYFLLPKDAWWTEYYRPLEIRIKQLRIKYENDQESLKILQEHQNEIDMVKKNPEISGSAFFIMQKLQKS